MSEEQACNDIYPTMVVENPEYIYDGLVTNPRKIKLFCPIHGNCTGNHLAIGTPPAKLQYRCGYCYGDFILSHFPSIKIEVIKDE